MLAVIISLFLLANMPTAIAITLMCIAYTFNFHEDWSIFAMLVQSLPICNLIVIATYPINLAVYMMMSHQFRRTLLDLLYCRARLTNGGTTDISAISMRDLRISTTHVDSASSQLNCGRRFSFGREAQFLLRPPGVKRSRSESHTLREHFLELAIRNDERRIF